MVEALRALVREALRDPMNQRFQLLCEYSLPLQSPLLVYQQFIKEPKSRLNACNTWDWQEHVSAPLCPGALTPVPDRHHETDCLSVEPYMRSPLSRIASKAPVLQSAGSEVGMVVLQRTNSSRDRWTPKMLPTIPEALWRKSSQWVELTRPHAMRIAEDTAVDAVIKKHCTVGYDRKLRR